jgi:SpoVK/Ycf46/Vps4 family AAA+-type ATPase
MLARVVAAQCRANFLNVGIPDIIRSGVGDSEKAIATVFKLALTVRFARCPLAEKMPLP